MAVPFDHISFAYRAGFAETLIEQLQRKNVWRYLEKITPQLNGTDILELNCGESDEAGVFNDEGLNIVATDLSETLLQITSNKNQVSLSNRICSRYIDSESFDETVFNKKFNLIFVNFGGLNSIHPRVLQRLLQKIPSLLSERGRVIAVTIPKLRLREAIHCLLRFQLINAFRAIRQQSTSLVIRGIRKWFHTPAQIREWTNERFKLISLKPVGHHSKYTFLSDSTDNVLIDLQLK